MKEKIKRTLTYFIFPFTLIAIVIGSVFHVSQKEKPKKEEEFNIAKESPHIVETQYPDPFRGGNLIFRSINASASAVNAFDDFLNKKL